MDAGMMDGMGRTREPKVEAHTFFFHVQTVEVREDVCTDKIRRDTQVHSVTNSNGWQDLNFTPIKV